MKSKSQPSISQFHPGLAGVIAAAPGLAVVAYGRDGKIAWFNEGAERLFGYRSDTVQGIADYEVLHAREEFVRYFNAGFLENPRPWTARLSAITRQRELLPVEATLYPFAEDGLAWLVLYRDLTQEHRLEEEVEHLREGGALEKSHTEREAEFLRELLGRTMETIQIGLAVTEMESGMIAYMNEGFEAISGFHRVESLGHTFESILRPYPATSSRLMTFLDGVRAIMDRSAPPPPNGHWQLEFPSGKRVVEVYGRPIVVEGHEHRYLLLILEDHTDRHRLQMQLVQSEKLAAIGQLAAGIAHELRNPLSTIFHALYDLNEVMQPRPEGATEDIEICMDEIKRVQDIITNLLDFAREGERSTGQTNLNDVLQRTLRLVQHDLENKNIETLMELEDGLPDVAMNNNALKQILINIITNGAQSMEAGGKLMVSTQRRTGAVPIGKASSLGTVSRSHEGGHTMRLSGDQRPHGYPPGMAEEHVVLTISDTGSGIDQEMLVHIFNPFFTTKEPGSGTGLGLSVVHTLVRDAGGAITVETTPQKGTTFTIELPAIPREDGG